MSLLDSDLLEGSYVVHDVCILEVIETRPDKWLHFVRILYHQHAQNLGKIVSDNKVDTFTWEELYITSPPRN